MLAYNLKVNRLTKPMGIDACAPIISWLAKDGKKQTAFRVTLESKSGVICDSGVVTSDAMLYVSPVGVPSRTKVDVSVSLCDENGAWGEEAHTTFETGLAPSDWMAKWIDPELKKLQSNGRFAENGNEMADTRKYMFAKDGDPLSKASYLKKTFTLDTLGDARLYITAHGIYNAYINGVEVEGYFLAPGTSYYEERIQAQTYDVTDLLREGDNEIIVTLGEGWWRGSTGWNMTRFCYGMNLALLAQLEIDGKVALVTDESWVASQNGPLMENDTMRIERCDARRVINDWHEVLVDDYFGYDNIIGTDIPITKGERFKAKLITTPNGERVLDFGQNFAGYVEFELDAKAGDFIRLTHGEVLDKFGNFQNDNFQNGQSPLCRQIVEYTCKDGKNKFHQTKCYYGFRYAKVETDIAITGDEFTGVAVYSDMKQTGFFECGVPDVNQFFRNVIWSMKSNFVDVPTDCPTREKLGFTGDAQVFTNAALHLMDSFPVLRRWMRESVACQEDGCILYVAPPLEGPQHRVRGGDGIAGWSNSITIVTDRFLHYLNSPEELREFYEPIKAWLEFNLGRAAVKTREENEHYPEFVKKYLLDSFNQLGEWNEPGKTPRDYAAEREKTGHAEVATAFLAYDFYLAAEIAKRLGEDEDAERYTKIYEDVKTAYRYVFTDNGKITSERQCHYVRPIAHHLLDGDENLEAAKELDVLIKRGGNHVGTGFLTTGYLAETLSELGYNSTAYDILLQEEAPSWLYEVKMGATTTWESWYGIREDGTRYSSHNHYSLGAVAGWMITHSLGIGVRDGKITLKPYTDERLGYAKGSYLSTMGEVRSAWKYEEDEIHFSFEIPANAEADILLPNGETHHVTTGLYTYSIKR